MKDKMKNLQSKAPMPAQQSDCKRDGRGFEFFSNMSLLILIPAPLEQTVSRKDNI